MKKVLVLDGSMRKFGNTSYLVDCFIKGANSNTDQIEHVHVKDLNIEYCNGCLRCNLIKRCSITNDDWNEVQQKIQDADILVFASPIYFHYLTSPLKKLIDRFRSFIHFQITGDGIKHTPHNLWDKEFVLLLSMGSSDNIDAKPVLDLFDYMKDVLGGRNKLHVVQATRLAVIKQIIKTEKELKELYPKLQLDPNLARQDVINNQKILDSCFDLGRKLTS